jgi:hypothetical protein
MATLAKDTPRQYELNGGDPVWNEIDIIAADTIYVGAAVGESVSTGTARPLVAADTFIGFCVETCANETGAASAKRVKIRPKGRVWLTVTNGDNINDFGDTVYASDDNTFTMATTGNSAIGKLVRYDATRTPSCLVAYEGVAERSI